jgi:DNA-binding MarR family transcriptional regulator
MPSTIAASIALSFREYVCIMHGYPTTQGESISVHDAHLSRCLRDIHGAVLDIVAVINRPERDDILIREAGIRLERALFPLVVLIERFGPIGVVDLAGRVGRDHSTVSRQVGQLITLGLADRRPNPTDRRAREVIISKDGRAMTARIDAARERLGKRALGDWPTAELDQLASLMRRYANALQQPDKKDDVQLKD